MSINYEEAAKLGSGGDELSNFPVFAAALYQCKIIEVEHKPDNMWDGKPKPCYTFKMQPQKTALGDGKMVNTDGKEHENFYVHDETQEDRPRFFYYNVNLPATLHEKSNFGKLATALFANPEKAEYTEWEHFIGDTILCQIEVTKNKDTGKVSNKIASLMNDPENKIKVKAELGKIATNDLDAAMAEDGVEVEDGRAKTNG